MESSFAGMPTKDSPCVEAVCHEASSFRSLLARYAQSLSQAHPSDEMPSSSSTPPLVPPPLVSLEGFYQACLQEQVDAPPRPWNTANYSHREVLGHTEPIDVSRLSTMECPRFPDVQDSPAGGQLLCPVMMLHMLVFGPHSVTMASTESDARIQPADTNGSRPGGGRRARGRRLRGRALWQVTANSRREVLQVDTEVACPVCLENLLPGEEVRTLPCFHMLHVECSDRYFRTRGVMPACPLCRYNVAVRSEQDSLARRTQAATFS